MRAEDAIYGVYGISVFRRLDGDLVADMAACIAPERDDLSHQTSARTTSRSIDLAQKPFSLQAGEDGVLTGRYLLG